MSNVIQFLETIGRGPGLRPEQYAAVVSSLDVDAGQRDALLARDGERLSQALGGRGEARCLIYVPD